MIQATRTQAPQYFRYGSRITLAANPTYKFWIPAPVRFEGRLFSGMIFWGQCRNAQLLKAA